MTDKNILFQSVFSNDDAISKLRLQKWGYGIVKTIFKS